MSLLQTPTRHSSDPNFYTWRFETSGGAPQLAFTDMSSLMMDGTPFSKPQTTHSSPNLFQNTALPIRDEFRNTPSHPYSIFTPRKASDANEASSASSIATPESTEEASPWCAAVGRASLGKSGRVIERLMADVDRLRRELNAEIAKRQEIERREETNKGAIDTMLTESVNLRHAKEIDAAAIKRRDRKIEELRAGVEVESSKRIRAEQLYKDALQQRDDVIAHSQREVTEAKDQAKQAEGHAELLGHSHRQLGNEYRQRTETFANDLQALAEDRDEERRKVRRLDIVVEQMRHELARTNKINLQMSTTFEAYKDGTEARIKSLEADAAEQQAADSALREETRRIVGEARWLINVGRNASKSEYLPLED